MAGLLASHSPTGVTASGEVAVPVPTARLGRASRLFGYDLFISFALGPAPRGTHSYASDLARRMRELDFSVFFSEDEAPPGDRLDATLSRALLRSKALVVVANRAALADPRWVRVEVEEFRQRHPDRPVVAISVDGALEDPQVRGQVEGWLPVGSRIWLNESVTAVESGIASDDVVARLALAPTKLRSNLLWRWVLIAVSALMSGLAVAAAIGWWTSASNAREAEHQRVQAERSEGEARRQQSLAEAGQQLAREKAQEATDEAARARREQQRADSERQRAETESARARREREGALMQLRRAVSLQLAAESRAMLAGLRKESDFRAMVGLIAAHRVAPGTEVDGELLDALGLLASTLKIVPTGVPVTSVAYAPDVPRVVSAHADGTIQFWNAESGQPLSPPLQGHREPIRRLAFSPDGSRLATAGADRLVGIWDARSGNLMALASGHEYGVESVAFSPDGSRIVSGSSDDTLRIWDASTGAPIGVPIHVHIRSEMYMGGGSVGGVAFTPDGSRIVSASGTIIGGSNTVRIWDAKTSARLNTLSGHRGTVNAVAVSPDGKLIVSASDDKTLRVWNAQTGQLIGQPLEGHGASISDLAFSQDSALLVSAGQDRTIRVWKLQGEAKLVRNLVGHDDSVNGIAFSRDGTRIVSGSADATLRIWDATGASAFGRLVRAGESAVHALAFSPDGTRLVSGGSGAAKVWNVSTGDPTVGPLRGHGDWVTAVAFSPDGTRIVGGGGGGFFSGAFGPTDYSLRQWLSVDGQPYAKPAAGHRKSVRSVVYSPDGKTILSGGAEGQLHVWDAQTGAPAQLSLGSNFRGYEDSILAAQFSPDGRRIAYASSDGTFNWWDLAARKTIGWPVGKLVDLEANQLEEVPRCAAISPDARRVALGRRGPASARFAIAVWDTVTGKPMMPLLQGHTDDPLALAFGPDNRLLVSGSKDGMVIAWDTHTGKAIGSPLRAHEAAVATVAVSPDGQHFASGDSQGHLRIWPSPLRWPQAVCDKLTRNMSRQEWAEWVSPSVDYVVQCPGLPVPAAVQARR